jgi:thiamine phosphate synthase YjbQ (UPF0047 family)
LYDDGLKGQHQKNREVVDITGLRRQQLANNKRGVCHLYNPGHVPDHILASIIGTSLVVPVKNREPVLGEWQKIILWNSMGRARGKSP